MRSHRRSSTTARHATFPAVKNPLCLVHDIAGALVPPNDEGGRRSALLIRSELAFVKAKWVPDKTPLAKAYQAVYIKLLGR